MIYKAPEKGMPMLQDHQNFDVDEAFEAGLSETSNLWRRLGVKPDFTGLDVMEVGSGLGFLTADIALAGAKSVLGIDTWEQRVEWGTKKLAERFPQLTNARFDSTPTNEMAGEARFDVIVSQNTFEHIADIDSVLHSFRRLLRPGGRAYIGFSPMYHSPFGDHGELRARVRLPWLHLIAGRKRVIAAYNKANGENVTTLIECGFNALKPADFRRAFLKSGLVVESLRVNPTEGGLKQRIMDAFALISKIPGLEPYFATGMYAVLRKP
jgi:SAM-dependent methyltransferase